MKSSFLFFVILVAGCVSGPRPWEKKFLKEPVYYVPRSGTPERENQPLQRLPIDLDTVLRLAAENNLDVAQMRETVHAAYGRALSADEKFFPTVSPLIRFWRLEGLTQGTGGEFVDVDKQNILAAAGFSLRWQIGDAVYSVLSSRRRYEASGSNLEAESRNVLLSAATVHFELVRHDQRAMIQEKAVTISEQLVKETQEAVDAGKGFQGDLLRARAQLAHNKILLADASQALKQASVRLASILRLDSGVDLYPVETVPVPLKLVDETKIENLVETALSRRPEITAARKELEAAGFDKNSASWGPLIPDLQVDATFGEFGGTAGNLDSQNVYQALLTWRIGPGGLFDSGRQNQADAMIRSAEIGYAKTRQRVVDEVRNAFAAVLAKTDGMMLAESEVKDAEEALKLSQERQALGGGIPLEVILAEEALTRARVDYANSVADYNAAQFQLLMHSGASHKLK